MAPGCTKPPASHGAKQQSSFAQILLSGVYQLAKDHRQRTLALVSLWLALILASSGVDIARGQQPRPRIWDVQPGTTVGELPEEEFVDPARGTNGGPPGLRIGSFEQFELCRPEPSGLREIWFRYDDEVEYIARATRDPDAAA